MKIRFILSAFLLNFLMMVPLLAALPADELRALSSRASAERFPQADRVLLYDIEKHTYQPDGKSVVTDECYEKVLTDRGRLSLRSLSLQYSSDYRKAEIPLLEVIRPDGSVHPVDLAANSREAISTGSMGANIYDPAGKILTVNIPELEIGDIVHYIIRQEDLRVRVPDHWSDIFILQYDFPILFYEVQVDAPAALPLRSIVIKDEVKDTIVFSKKEAGDRILYSWQAKDVPQVIPEPHMPPLYTCVQRVLVSTSGNWQEISKWYWKLCQPHLDKVTPEIRQKTAELTANAKTDDEKIMAVFQFVSQQIRYMGITAETEAPGLEPHDVSMTFANRYGVCRDKAALLVAMLREAGFQAFPVLFMAGDPKDAEVANSFFNHAIAAVERGTGVYTLMDPTDESTTELLPSYLSNKSYLVARPEGETLLRSPVIPAEKNLLNITSELTVSQDNCLNGVTTLAFDGINDRLYRDAFSYWSPSERKQFFDRVLRRILPGAELKGISVLPENIRDMSVPLQVKLDYTLEKALGTGASEFLLPVPVFSRSVGGAALFVEQQLGLTKRQFPMTFPSTCGAKEKLKLKLPTRYQTVFLPAGKELGFDGLVNFKRTFEVQGNTLVMERFFELENVEVSAPDYLKLKEAFRHISTDKAVPMAREENPAELTLKEAAERYPRVNAVVLDEMVDCTVSAVDTWEVQTSRKMMVLNYSGVKQHSELLIPYNPVWESVSVEGRVRMPDGSIRELSGKELNVMDAAWVSHAPRYPAEKQLAVSFPGVVPGSVIEYTVKREYRKHPFFELSELFAAETPILHKKVTVTAPAELKLNVSGAGKDIRFKREELAGKKVQYSWVGSALPEIPPELYRAPDWMFVPGVFVSAGNYAEFAKELNRVLQEKIAAGDPQAVNVLLEKLKTLPLKGNSKEQLRQQIRFIRDWISEQISEVGPALNTIPFSNISPAGVTLKSRFGNSADLAVLYGTVLKKLGIEYRFVAVSEIPAVNAAQQLLGRYPSNCFSSVLLYLPELSLYLNDSDRFSPLGSVHHRDRIGLDLQKGHFQIIRPDHAGTPRDVRSFQLKVKPDGNAELFYTRRTFGSLAGERHRFYAHTVKKKQEIYFQEVAASIYQGAVLTKSPAVDLSVPDVVTEEFTLTLPGYAALEEEYIQFALPGFDALAGRIRCSGIPRETPGIRSQAERLEMSYRIMLPEGFRMVNVRPEKQTWGNYAHGTYQETFKTVSGELRAGFSLNLPVQLIAPQDYDRVVELERRLLDRSVNYVIAKQERDK